MPTTITTEQARVTLAHREFNHADAETREQIQARMKTLRNDPRATSFAAFEKLCRADPELEKLALDIIAHQVWRDANIQTGAVATIEDDGRVRWTLPQYAKQPN